MKIDDLKAGNIYYIEYDDLVNYTRTYFGPAEFKRQLKEDEIYPAGSLEFYCLECGELGYFSIDDVSYLVREKIISEKDLLDWFESLSPGRQKEIVEEEGSFKNKLKKYYED